MIDTVTFVLHNLNTKVMEIHPDKSKYKSNFNRLLYERLCNFESQYVFRTKEFMNEAIIFNPDDDYFKRKQINSVGVVKRKGAVQENLRGKDFFFYPVKGKMQTASSNYTCNFKVNDNNDSVSFTLSIPKYFYSHNIAQFVPNSQSEAFKKNPFTLREWKGQIRLIKQRLIAFIYTFFDDVSTFLGIHNFNEFDIQDIEIKRLDLCYNQYFPSEDMAKDYLIAQKKLRQSRCKRNTIVKQDYDTSFAYRHAVDGFYFKIYHKGSEFQDVDLPKLVKDNKDYLEIHFSKYRNSLLSIFEAHFSTTYKKLKGKVEDLIFSYYATYVNSNEHQSYVRAVEDYLPFKANFLLREANKILRYEMSFTTTYMSTLYKREIFRKNDLDWLELMKDYRVIKSYDLKLERNREIANLFAKRKNITKDMRISYELIHKSLAKKHEFFLVTPKELQAHERHFNTFDLLRFQKNWQKAYFEEKKEASLSQELIELLFARFKEEIDYFQVKEVEETNTTLDLIDKYNAEVQRKINGLKKTLGSGYDAYMKSLKQSQKKERGLCKIQTSRLKILLDRMNEGKSMDEVFEELALKKTAVWSIKKDLEKFNIFRTGIKTKYSFRNIVTDFSKYYENFQLNRNYNRYFFHNPNLISFDVIRNKHQHSFFYQS